MRNSTPDPPSPLERLPAEPEMIHIPAGPFTMGTSERQIDRLVQQMDQARVWKAKDRFAREQPQHTVTLPDYFIGRHPVTVGEYRAFVEADGYHHPHFWTSTGWAWRQAKGAREPEYWSDNRWTGDDRLPVVGVTWHEACAYCRWLSEATGRDYRLPTEAEWEKAARGTSDRLYPWGDAFDPTRCNVRASRLGRTTPVGQYSPRLQPELVDGGDSPYGCSGMAGNVSEWTLSQFRPYPCEAPFAAGVGRNDPEGDAARVTRGGSWHSLALRARTTARGMNDPFFSDDDLGFRCARSQE